MKLLEYEAKSLLQKHDLYIPAGEVTTSAAPQTTLPFPVVVKAQIPKGGRGKAGGVRPVHDSNELQQTSHELLSKPLLGCKVQSLLLEEALDIEHEYYISIALDRHEQSFLLIAHKNGGVDIETASKVEAPLRAPLQAAPTNTLVKKLLRYFNLSEELFTELFALLQGLWQTCVEEDALLIEINPLILTKQGTLVCADAKIELDDAAAFRHNWHFEAKPASTQFVVLHAQGTVASMANGAGLAMATVDAIKAAGAEPANFFDVGGGTHVAGMVRAFEKMAALPNVRAIVVNIFGGITRCDEVARAILTARDTVAHLPLLFIRLTGTNETEGQRLLNEAGVATLPTLADCVAAATKEVGHV